MNVQRNDPPREFEVGFGPKVTIRHCADIALNANEQVTFTTEVGGEYDVVRKSWGFYATPSVNGRLARFGLRTALVKNRNDQFFVLLVERGHEADFQQYVDEEGLIVSGWLDDEETLQRFQQTGKAA